ncbi:MAG: hypothetical protein LCH56_16205 [Proteobacteria bacterium]|nr:hypothetical protein [Pseudomonadota bacterium]
MKTSQDQIADILSHAPAVPRLVRKAQPKIEGLSDETKAHLIALHIDYATYGHPLVQSHLV